MNEDLTRQLLRRIAALERRLGIVETSESEAAHSHAYSDHGNLTGLADDDHTQYLLAAGTRALTADWDIGDGRKLSADTLAARDAAGLPLQDDGGNVGLTIEDGGRVNIGNQTMNQRNTYSRHTAAGTAVASGGSIFNILGTSTNYRYTLLRVTFTQHVASTNLANHCAASALINIGNHSGGLTAAVLSHELIKNRKIAVSVVGGGWAFKITDAAGANVAVETYHSITVEMWGWYTGSGSGVGYPVFYP